MRRYEAFVYVFPSHENFREDFEEFLREGWDREIGTVRGYTAHPVAIWVNSSRSFMVGVTERHLWVHLPFGEVAIPLPEPIQELVAAIDKISDDTGWVTGQQVMEAIRAEETRAAS
jgi:hypothetical protein